jgi:hypothetical protein
MQRELDAALEQRRAEEAARAKEKTQPRYTQPLARLHACTCHVLTSVCACASTRMATPGAPSATPRGRREPGTPMRRPMGL